MAPLPEQHVDYLYELRHHPAHVGTVEYGDEDTVLYAAAVNAYDTGTTDVLLRLAEINAPVPGVRDGHLYDHLMHLTPQRARDLAALLVRGAEKAEVGVAGWDDMSDVDKGIAIEHAFKCDRDDEGYVTLRYPARYRDHPELVAFGPEAASAHARHVTGGWVAILERIGRGEVERLCKVAGDRERAA